MPHFRLLSLLGDRLSFVQSILSLERWTGYPQYEDDKGLGRVALLSCILSLILGINLILCLQLVLINMGMLPKDIVGDWSDERRQMAVQWTVYVIVLCTFHLAEFFTTSIFNPSVTSADSFMVCIIHTEHFYFRKYLSDCVITLFVGESFQGIYRSRNSEF